MKASKQNKKLIQEAIVLAVDSISEDIRSSTDEEKNLKRAEAIKALAQAYEKVKR